MSGHKRTTVTISQEEYRRLYEAEMALRGMDLLTQEVIQQPSQETLSFLSQQIHSTLQRQEDFLRLGQEFQTEIFNLENQTAHRLREIQNQILEGFYQEREGFVNLIEQIQANMSLIEDQALRDHEENQRRFAELEFQTNRVLEKEKHKFELAYQWLNDCVQIYNFILENYPESIPHLEELNILSSQLNFALQNFDMGIYETAISAGQAIYFSLSSLRVKLEKEGLEKRKILAEILDELQIVQKLIQDNREIKPVDIQGNLLDTFISVDEWTENSLFNLEEAITSMIAQFKERGLEQSIENLREFQANEIPTIKREFSEALHRARLNALNAHLNYLIAHDVLLALIEQGYKPVEGQYSLEERDSYIARAIDPLGNMVEILVQTSSPEKVEHNLHIISTQNHSQSLHELRQRAKEIQRSLNRIGWVANEPMEISASVQREALKSKKHLLVTGRE